MSIYKSPRSPYWQYDFEIGGHRFYGSTKATVKREAEAVERAEREKAEQKVAQIKAARTSLRLDDVAGRYWQEVGQYHKRADNTWRMLSLVVECLGKDRLITDITDADAIKLVAWRRGHTARPGGPLLSPFTVNDTTKQLKKLFNRAKVWGVRFEHGPQWRRHLLKEPPERLRELHEGEADRLEMATRDDLAPFFAFAMASGMRLSECLLRWPEVDFPNRQIHKQGKGGKPVLVPITPTIRAILWPLQGHHPEFVFTFVAQRTGRGRVKGRIKGQRYPLTAGGVRAAWRRLRDRADVSNFRFHDFRHDFATKLLRETGNLKLVQKALNHADIASTLRYAHVLDDEVADAMERVAKSRKKSRSKLRGVS
jgi:integrase